MKLCVLQAMVPLWDLLNHVTGQANVRLHHCSDKGCLQMIATKDIPAGAELINNYGDLSNGELLRRCKSSTKLPGLSTSAVHSLR
jgi:N-lysine methyltransferase SETD6